MSCCVVLGIGFEWIGFCEMEEFNFKVDAVRPGVVDVRDNILEGDGSWNRNRWLL